MLMRKFSVAVLTAFVLCSAALASSYHTPAFVEKVGQEYWEHEPFVHNGVLYRAGFKRSWTGWSGTEVIIDQYDPVKNVFFKVAHLPWANALGSVAVNNGEVYIFGTTQTVAGNSIKKRKLDQATWTWDGPETNVYTAPAGVTIYNTSVTKGPDKWVLVYETNEGTNPFSARFLQSTDLATWTPVGGLMHGSFYSACPSIHYAEDGWYIVTYMWNNGGTYETAIARTKDFVTISTFQGNPANGLTAFHHLLSPDAHEGPNNSDFAMTEFNGKVYMVYLIGDQSTWGNIGQAWYDGTLLDFYHEYWP